MADNAWQFCPLAGRGAAATTVVGAFQQGLRCGGEPPPSAFQAATSPRVGRI